MKKIILAAAVASLTFGASAAQFNRAINFSNLSNTAEKTIEISGNVPERCLLRLGRSGVMQNLDVLYNAKNSAQIVAPSNDEVLIANLRAWCNHGTGLTITFDSANGGLTNGVDTINYRLFAESNNVFRSNNPGARQLDVSWTGIHLENQIKKIPLYIKPQRSGFARSGDYNDTITVTLAASM